MIVLLIGTKVQNVVHMGATAANHHDVPPLLAADGLAGRNDMELFVFSDEDEKKVLDHCKIGQPW